MSLFAPRTEVVKVYTGDYLQRIGDLRRRAEAAAASYERTVRRNDGEEPPMTLDEEPEHLRLAQEHDELVDEAEAVGAVVPVRIQALPRKVWTQLVAEHPARDGNRDDKLDGVNTATFPDALLTVGRTLENGTEYRTVVEPEGLTDDDLEQLSSVDFTRLYIAAYRLNRGVPEDPKASLVSLMTQTKDETSS